MLEQIEAELAHEKLERAKERRFPRRAEFIRPLVTTSRVTKPPQADLFRLRGRPRSAGAAPPSGI
jgi:hypothetical protein